LFFNLKASPSTKGRKISCGRAAEYGIKRAVEGLCTGKTVVADSAEVQTMIKCRSFDEVLDFAILQEE